MGSDKICQFILERISVPGVVILDKPEHTYTCGRAKDNQIVCLSLTVSRRHCIFFHSKTELYVTDLKSSNGLFINGVPQQPFQTTKLQPNDVIGIGCPDVDVPDNAMFAYRLRIITVPEVTENNQNITPVLETMLNFENTAVNKSDTAIKRKREEKNNDIKLLPNKIPKLDNENYFSDKNSIEENCEINDENDIEVIHVSLNNSNTEQNNIQHNFKKNVESSNKLNADKQSMKQPESLSTGKIENSIQEKENSAAVCKDQEQSKKSVQNAESDHIVPKAVTEKNDENIKTNLKDMISNTKQKSNPCSKASNSVNNAKTSNEIDSTNTFITKNNECTNSTTLPSNFVSNGDTLIKLEEELQLTDTDEEVYNSFKDSVLPAVSPIKLKKVQHQPKTQFSEVDVVNLSDSEDDIFPCSQLFDIKFGMDNSIKNEVKEEPMAIENERFNILDDAELITMTDSEDEDNNWLHKLSRSQLLNEDDEVDVKVKDLKVKTEDVGIKIIDDSDKIVADTVTKVKEPEEEKDISVPGTSNDTEACVPDFPTERMDVDFVDHNKELIEPPSSIIDRSSKEFPESSSDQGLLLNQTKKESHTSNLSVTTQKMIFPTKKKSLEKKVPQIEPPRLSTNRRSSSSNTIKEIRGKPPKQRLTSKEKKEQQERLKVEEYLRMKELKNRKLIHKWADCLPPNKKKVSSTLTKEEKKVLADRRKVKLKKLAMEEKRLSLEDNQEKKRAATKPKAKVTMKTRNDFLVEETISASKSDDTTERPKSSSNHSATANTSVSPKTTKSAKSKDASKDIESRLRRTLILSDVPNIGKIPKKRNAAKVKLNNTAKEVPSMNKAERVTETNRKETELSEKLRTGLSVSAPKESTSKEPTLVNKSNIKTPGPKSKKRVSFSANIQTVREYQIDESNVLRKLVGKDAPIPSEKVPARRPINAMELNAKLNEFLSRIFSWNPIWLEEQQYLNTPAPVVRNEEIHVMLTHYKSYDEYYKIIAPLLLLETWHSITKEFQNIEQSYKRPTLMCSVVENSVQRNMVSQNVVLTTLMVEVLVSREDIRSQMHPVFGDLVFFEYAKNHEKGQMFHKIFAYVTNVHETVLTHQTRYNKDLRNYVRNPHSLLTYTMKTKPLENNILVNRVQRLRTVTYLRPSLRLVQALQYLPNSPLADLILNPTIEMYQLPVVTEMETLITGDKLNEKQLEAVHKVTEAVVKKDAKMCFIQGPPGTGKSKVIVNIVTQTLYGNNRYINNRSSLKILVCAPSNAAIDEIVLRLLEIRSNIKHKAKIKPFKMVRFGRPDVMHATVKNISVTELAKRDIDKQMACSSNVPLESVENEKLHLESRMNALKTQLTTSHSMDETYRQHIKMKLEDMAAKYELLKNCRSSNNRNEREYIRLLRAAENRILEHADIITCTLSSCYTNQMESIFGGNRKQISVCIVDEATQSCEAETLIPLMLGINILVLVGDPNQLPATVLSPQAKKYGLDQSIFSRVQNAFDFHPNNPIIMLDTQYRMQHTISFWPNKFFYGGILKNAVERSFKFPFYPYRILNLNTNQNEDQFSNDDEAEFVANMIYSMLTFSNLDSWESCISCGILTPYNNQKSVIVEKINEKISPLPENVKRKMKFDVNTVDGFQGQERDVIIMSCVRSQRIGFLSDRQRLCVAITRAKHSMIICGNFNIFMKDLMWNSLLSDAKSRKVYFNVNANVRPHEIKSYIIRCIADK